MKKYKCYVCGKGVSRKENEVKGALVDQLHRHFKEIADWYDENFVHCIGEPSCFNEDGYVVVCLRCFCDFVKGAIVNAPRKHRK